MLVELFSRTWSNDKPSIFNLESKKTVETLAAWTNLKEKITKTIQTLKTNHKDNWALVKPKSIPYQAPTTEALTTYNLSQDHIVIAENKLDKTERKLERVRDLVASKEIKKLESLIKNGII